MLYSQGRGGVTISKNLLFSLLGRREAKICNKNGTEKTNVVIYECLCKAAIMALVLLVIVCHLLLFLCLITEVANAAVRCH
jgi:hypothetical protein